MNFERKNKPNQFLPILSEKQEKNLKNPPEVFKLESTSILAIRNQTHN